jgi:preprotein translocase subunit SecD
MTNHLKGYLTDRRILILIVVVAVLAVCDLHFGLNFGIEFAGGTQIPITLEHPVNVTAMSSLVAALQQRVSTFGLKQTTVEGVGDSHVYVEIPTVSLSEVNQTIGIIQSQGRFDGIVSGREAINGSGILKGSIGAVSPSSINGTVQWAVTFYITDAGAKQFNKVVLGQANQPLYMFLDRPTNAIVVINSSQLSVGNAGLSSGISLAAMKQALGFGTATIPIITVSNSNSSINSTKTLLTQDRTKYKEIIASANLPPTLLSFMKAQNYTVILETKGNMTPQITAISANQSVVETWPAVGLLSSPVLNPSITNGTAGNSYEISGVAPSNLSAAAKTAYALTTGKTIESILNGGALPVAIIAGTPETIPATLGSQFLFYSAVAGVLAILLVSIFITIRYRKIFLVLPILLTTFMELFIIVSIIGLLGTIDLAAVAGMIAVVGTGVDAQIIITDELLRHTGESGSPKSVMQGAFYIILRDALLLIVVMLPLFFSTSLVSVVGFAESTIIGAILGFMITRPAYGAIISKHYSA